MRYFANFAIVMAACGILVLLGLGIGLSYGDKKVQEALSQKALSESLEMAATNRRLECENRLLDVTVLIQRMEDAIESMENNRE